MDARFPATCAGRGPEPSRARTRPQRAVSARTRVPARAPAGLPGRRGRARKAPCAERVVCGCARSSRAVVRAPSPAPPLPAAPRAVGPLVSPKATGPSFLGAERPSGGKKAPKAGFKGLSSGSPSAPCPRPDQVLGGQEGHPDCRPRHAEEDRPPGSEPGLRVCASPELGRGGGGSLPRAGPCRGGGGGVSAQSWGAGGVSVQSGQCLRPDVAPEGMRQVPLVSPWVCPPARGPAAQARQGRLWSPASLLTVTSRTSVRWGWEGSWGFPGGAVGGRLSLCVCARASVHGRRSSGLQGSCLCLRAGFQRV